MNGYLLDSHAALWWWTNHPRLSEAARDVIADDMHRVWVSAASVWEIGIKAQAGRLPELPAFREEYSGLVASNQFGVMTVTDRHAIDAAFLPGDHRDPFDRLIAAQALVEGLTVVTRDRQIAAFGCEVLW